MMTPLAPLRLLERRLLALTLVALVQQLRPAAAGPLNYTFLGRYPLDGPAGGTVETDLPPGTPASALTHCQIDRHDPNVGWPGYSRPNGTKKTSDAIFMPATALPSGRVACHMSKGDFPMITSGNATLSVLPAGCAKASCEHVPTPACCTASSAYVELFALFEPQFGRRPYFYETEGSIIVLTDPSLAGSKLRLTATLPGGVEIDANLAEIPAGMKTPPFCAISTEIVILPRQARDKHRENSTRDAFSYGPEQAASGSGACRSIWPRSRQVCKAEKRPFFVLLRFD
jgi:hypothetical protein